MAFCLPCNHYNTSFPLASQCLDTHGETQPGTTRSIKGCPLQREGRRRNLSATVQKPCIPHFQPELEKGNDGRPQALFKSSALLMVQKKLFYTSRKDPSLKLDLNVERQEGSLYSAAPPGTLWMGTASALCTELLPGDRGASAAISPSEQTKHQLTLTCSWLRQPLRAVKWLGQMMLLEARTTEPAARQKSLE